MEKITPTKRGKLLYNFGVGFILYPFCISALLSILDWYDQTNFANLGGSGFVTILKIMTIPICIMGIIMVYMGKKSYCTEGRMALVHGKIICKK